MVKIVHVYIEREEKKDKNGEKEEKTFGDRLRARLHVHYSILAQFRLDSIFDGCSQNCQNDHIKKISFLLIPYFNMKVNWTEALTIIHQ